MTANEIWRIDPEGGEPQRVAGDLGVPDSVKFDADGFIVSTQVASGQVLRIDPRSGEQTVLAQLNPGLDNLTFADGRLFVSNFTGEITEILGGGRHPHRAAGRAELAAGPRGRRRRPAVRRGRHLLLRAGARRHTGRPWACCSPRGTRASCAAWRRRVPASSSSRPPVARSRATARARAKPTTSQTDSTSSTVWRSHPADAIVFAELGTGRVHATAVGQRRGAGIRPARSRRRRVRPRRRGPGRGVGRRPGGDGWPASGTETVVDGLQQPQGILVPGRSALHRRRGRQGGRRGRPETAARHTIASGLPVGPPPGVEPKPLQGHAAVLRTAGTVRRHRRRTRRHAVRLGRRRRQRARAATRPTRR